MKKVAIKPTIDQEKSSIHLIQLFDKAALIKLPYKTVHMRKLVFCTILLAISFLKLSAQITSGEKVKVFLECTYEWLCDFDYVRTELKMVDFVRDRFQSDVHVLVNIQFNSAGGEQHQLTFITGSRFAGMNDTLTYYNDPTATQDDKRRKLVQYLKLGLTRYVARTNASSKMLISYVADTTNKGIAEAPPKDKWNYWVYQFGTSIYLNGNQNYNSRYFYGYINADRETEEWKTNFYVSFNKSKDIFKEDGEETEFLSKNYSAGAQVAKSIDKHWSYGLSANYQNYLYGNIKAGYLVRPKLEYSVFPYEKFNTQRIVFQYLIGPQYNKYYDTTVYFKTEEWQLQQSMNIITSFTKPWGSVNVGIFYSSYFEDFKKYNLSFNGGINWKIAKGLLFGVYGYYALVHDQIALRKGDATRDEILRQNRELLSSFEFNLGFGFSYRFGSISNSIVNPRFRGLNYSVSW